MQKKLMFVSMVVLFLGMFLVPSSAQAQIAGSVYGQDWNPLQGASVLVTQYDVNTRSQVFRAWGQTNQSGEFWLTPSDQPWFPNGNYLVKISHWNHQSESRTVQVMYGFARLDEVILGADMPGLGLSVYTQSYYGFGGFVIWEVSRYGKPITGFDVTTTVSLPAVTKEYTQISRSGNYGWIYIPADTIPDGSLVCGQVRITSRKRGELFVYSDSNWFCINYSPNTSTWTGGGKGSTIPQELQADLPKVPSATK